MHGRRIEAADGVRPTSARVRESLMDIWAPQLAGARVLELFAGSGAIGIESISRGAIFVHFIDMRPEVLDRLQRNCRLLEADQYRIDRRTLPVGLASLLAREERGFDLIFADPPYGYVAYDELVGACVPLLADGGEVVLEHAARSPLPARLGGLVRVEERRFGDTALSFYRADSAPASECRKNASSSR